MGGMRTLMNATNGCDSGKPSYVRIKDDQWYEFIKREGWKIPVLDRLYRVEEDVRRAISAAGWTLVDNDGEISISTRAGQARSMLMDEAEAVVKTTFEYINRAGQSLGPAPRRWRYWQAVFRESLMPAYINLHSAETSRVLLLSADQLMAVLPSIRQRVAAYLPMEDPRRVALGSVPDLTAAASRMGNEIVRSVTEVYGKGQAPTAKPAPADADEGPGRDVALGADGTEAGGSVLARSGDQALGIRLTDILGRDQQIAAEAMGEACKAEDQQQFQVSRFRRMLFGTFVALLVLVVFMGIVGNIEPGYFPLCLAEQGAKGTMICPTGDHTPGGADLPLVLGLGAIGASLAVATSLARQKLVVGVRYSLSVAQGLVKVAFGALTAVLGIIILGTQTSNVPGILGTQAGLLTAAVVFGYAQQIFTRVIDKQASSLVNAASPSTPPTGQDPGSTSLTGTR
jgi:hypothetical protein